MPAVTSTIKIRFCMRLEKLFADMRQAIADGSFQLLFLVSIIACGVLFSFLGWATFSEDDAHVMRVAIESGWLDPYYNGEIYKQLSAANFTPFVLTLFRAVLVYLPLDSVSFLSVSAVFTALLAALAGVLSREIGSSACGAWLTVLLVLSNLAVTTLLSRFYTMHYVAGGVFALLALILSIRKPAGSVALVGIFTFLVFALLAKEVYVGVPLIVFILAWRTSNLKLGIVAVTAVIVYISMRLLVLGLPSGSGSSSYSASVFSLSLQNWLAFFAWYVETKWLLLLAVAISLFYAPLRFLKLLPFALLFLLPTFLAAHGYLNPRLHGDRIFFAFDSAMAVVVAITLSPLLMAKKNVTSVGMVLGLTIGLFLHMHYIAAYKAEEQSTADYRVTRYLMDSENAKVGKTFYVPLSFEQGELMIVERELDGKPFLATQNCILALQQPEDRLVVFDQGGNLSSRENLDASCKPAASPVRVNIAPRAIKGVVEWNLDVEPGFVGGALFIDRAIAVPVANFSRLMVVPGSGERYQLFAFKEDQWWFSAVAEMDIQR